MVPSLQFIGLGLDAAGALLLAADALAKLRMSAVEEAREEQSKFYGHWAGSEEEMDKDLRERWLPPVLRQRRLRGGGAFLLTLGFLLQLLGMILP